MKPADALELRGFGDPQRGRQATQAARARPVSGQEQSLELGLIPRSDERESERRDRDGASCRVDDRNRRAYAGHARRRGEQGDRDLLRQRDVCRVFRGRKNQDRLAINARPDDIENRLRLRPLAIL